MHILIVEDEVKLANAVKRGLELQNYIVDAVYDGQDGFDLASTGDFDLVLLDSMLPTLDGITICRMLRQQKNPVPILMLTAKGLVKDKVTGLDAGADDYLVKPFSFEELFSRIRALTRRHDQRGTLLSVADLQLDTQTKKVFRKKQPIAISNREFQVLEYLLRHKNKVVTREQILRHVWNYDADVLPNTVEVHIKHLREKIDKPFEAPLLYTVRGFGYELREK